MQTLAIAVAMMLAATGAAGTSADPVRSEESAPGNPGGAMSVTYWDHLTFDPGISLDGVGTPGSVVTAVDEHGHLGGDPVRVADDGRWSMTFLVLPVNTNSPPEQEDLTRLTLTQRTDGVVDNVTELDVGPDPASGFAVTSYEQPATGPHLAGVGVPGDAVSVRTCDQDFVDCGESRWFTVADDGRWYVVVPEPEATYALFDVFRDGTRIDGRSTLIFVEPWEWTEPTADPVLEGTRVDLHDGELPGTLAPLPDRSPPVDPGVWVDDPIFAAPRPGGEVAIRNAGVSLDGSSDLLFGVGTPGATVRVSAGDDDPDAVDATIAADGTWSTEHRRGSQTDAGTVTVTQTVEGKVVGTLDVNTGARQPEGFALTQVEGWEHSDFLAGEGTPGDTVVVRQCRPNYPACWLIGQFTVPDDGTWGYALLNRATGPTLMDVYRGGTWRGGGAAWVTEDAVPSGPSPVESEGAEVRLGPVAVPEPKALELDGGSGTPLPTAPASRSNAAEAGREDTADSDSLPTVFVWLLGIVGVLGFTGTVLFMVRRRS